MIDTTLTHADADELLPMLLADALTDAQSRAVREHVSTCLACRREQKHLALVRKSVQTNPSAADVPQPNPERVLRRIDEYEERRRRNPFKRLMYFGRKHPFFALAAQAALILLAVSLIVSPLDQEPEFTTLTQPEAVPAGQYVRAVFAPGQDDRSIERLVSSMDLRIVAGPTERGVYTLAADGQTGTFDYESLADALRANDGVLFADAVNVGGSQ